MRYPICTLSRDYIGNLIAALSLLTNSESLGVGGRWGGFSTLSRLVLGLRP